MLIVLSPAKTLDFETPVTAPEASEPALLAGAETIAKRMRRLSAARLGALMSISDKLAKENAARFKAWKADHASPDTRPAVFAFRGDVYRGLDVDTMSKAELRRAQKQLRILSGLYGVLRPLDHIRPYRLEMGTRVSIARKPDLYAYWDDRITDELNAAIRAAKASVLVNLASNEYFKAVRPDRLNVPIVTPVFMEKKDGKPRVMAFFAKHARGELARHLIRERVKTLDDVRAYRGSRYRFDAKLSSDDRIVFTRAYKTKT